MPPTLEYFITKTFSIFELTTAKMIVTGILSVLCFFFNELYATGLIAVVMLMVLDALLGVGASYYEGKEITSRRFVCSVKKGIVYLMAISAGHFADMTIPLAIIETTMIGFVGTTEFVSVLENVGRLGYSTPKKLLNQLRGKYE